MTRKESANLPDALPGAVPDAPPDAVDEVGTEAGTARVSWYRAAACPGERLVLALGHGAGGGIAARDLRAIARELPADGVTVALVEQPWRVAGKKLAPAPATLDLGWRGLWPRLAERGVPVVAGGRSAGARVACRTGRELGAAGVLALAFPLHPPGRPEKSRAAELLSAGLPTLVVQGGADPFGKPAEFPAVPPGATDAEGRYELVEVPAADHGFAVPKRAAITGIPAVTVITDAVRAWLAARWE